MPLFLFFLSLVLYSCSFFFFLNLENKILSKAELDGSARLLKPEWLHDTVERRTNEKRKTKRKVGKKGIQWLNYS